MTGKRWTKEDEEDLKLGIEEGLAYKEIGLILNRTLGAVSEKAKRLKLSKNKENYLGELTINRLKEYLFYDKETGKFTWIKTKHYNSRKGSIAGSRHVKGYIEIGFDGKNYLAHRLAWFYTKGIWPKEIIDHKDQNPSNNEWNNLREATKSTNGMNRGKPIHNTSGYKGVSWDKTNNKYSAYITKNAKRKFLGYYDTAKKAAIAYNIKAIELHKEFAALNTIKEDIHYD